MNKETRPREKSDLPKIEKLGFGYNVLNDLSLPRFEGSKGQ